MSDEKPKHKFLNDVYKNTLIGGEVREAITRKVLKSSPVRKGDYAQPKEDRIADYARQEKQKAETLAEQKWRQIFEDWKAEQVAKEKTIQTSSTNVAALDAMSSEPQVIVEGPDIQQEAPSFPSENMEHPSSAQNNPGDVDSLRRRVEIAETQAEQLREERDRFKQELEDLTQDFQSRHQELLDEGETASDMESRILLLTQERDSWKNRVLQRNTQLKHVAAVRQDLIARMTTLGGRIEHLSSNIASLHASSLADPVHDPGDAPEDVPPASA